VGKIYAMGQLVNTQDNSNILQILIEKIEEADASIVAGPGVAYGSGAALAQSVIARGEALVKLGIRDAVLPEVRIAFQDGIKSGRGKSAEEVFDRLEAKYRDMVSK
jgi:hypothetical protein